MKKYICNCIEPNFKKLGCKDVNEFSDLIDSAIEITKNEFLIECQETFLELRELFNYPDDFKFYKNREIYFFTHSCIEHFYK